MDSRTKLARMLAGAPRAARPFEASLSPTFHRGLVCAFNADGSLSISVNGSPSAIDADCLDSVTADVGDVVELHTFGTRLVVDGVLQAAAGEAGWVTPALANSWVAFDAIPPQYRLVGKQVFMRGSMRSGTSTTFLASPLPAACRPSTGVLVPVATNGGVINMNVNSNGTLVPVTLESGYTFFDGVSWWVD